MMSAIILQAPPPRRPPSYPLFSDWRIDVLFGLAILGLLISAWLFWVARRDREGTPKGMLTQLERVSFTLQQRGDIFRLAQATAFLLLMGAIIFVPGNHIDWLLGCLGFAIAIIPIHSALIVVLNRRTLPSVPGSSLARPFARVEQPSEEEP